MAEYDIVIRNGRIFDGTGAPGFDGDIAITDGRISAIGRIDGRGREEIDAAGKIVTPGFVDVHTHYDGQVCWSDRIDPSSLHGVTTAVMGNCGVGFAPVRTTDHDRLIRLMEGVEDIPFPVLTEGLPWSWESFPDYLDFLAGRQFDIDIAAQLPHAALRVYVMGERGANREPATPEDMAEMAKLAGEAVEAGALGFSTSRTLNHRTSDGQPTPTLTAAEEELQAIADALKAADKGVLQIVSDFNNPEKEAAMLRRLSESSGRPLSVSLAQADVAPDSWRALLDQIEKAREDGVEILAQVCGRPVGVLLGLSITMNPFSAHPVYQSIADKPLEERVRLLRDPAIREKLLNDQPDSDNPFVKAVLRRFDRMFLLGDPPNYEPDPSRLLANLAKSKGTTPEALALDLMLEKDGKALLYFPFLNYAQNSLDPSYDMLTSPATIPGLSDGGAHVGMICDGSFPTSMMTHWARDRSRGEKLPLEFVIRRQTRDTARAVGLLDRGILAPGYRADVNVIDFDNLTLHEPEVVYDLPAGGRRLTQRADGYDTTIVNGVVIRRNGAFTDARPGRLVRGAQPAPALAAAE